MAAAMPLPPRDSGEFLAVRAQLRATLRRVRASKDDPGSTVFKIHRTAMAKRAVTDEELEEQSED